MSSFATHALISVFVTAGALLAYDRLVVKPAQVIGIVDIAEVYRAKESEFAALLSASRRSALVGPISYSLISWALHALVFPQKSS